MSSSIQEVGSNSFGKYLYYRVLVVEGHIHLLLCWSLLVF